MVKSKPKVNSATSAPTVTRNIMTRGQKQQRAALQARQAVHDVSQFLFVDALHRCVCFASYIDGHCVDCIRTDKCPVFISYDHLHTKHSQEVDESEDDYDGVSVGRADRGHESGQWLNNSIKTPLHTTMNR